MIERGAYRCCNAAFPINGIRVKQTPILKKSTLQARMPDNQGTAHLVKHVIANGGKLT